MISEIEKYILKIIFNRKYNKWIKNREMNRIYKSRQIYHNNISLLPNESDFLSLIYEYCNENKYGLQDRNAYSRRDKFVFKILLLDGSSVMAFPFEMNKYDLMLKEEKEEKDGFHSVVDNNIYIKIYDIEKVDVIRDYDEFHVQKDLEPIYGYKAIRENNGRLQARSCEYRFNIPVREDIRNPYKADFQDCYMHFCKSLECVVMCPGRTDYLESIKNYKEDHPVIRLFKVKGEEHCVQYSGDWWVTNKLTLLVEVTKDEIYMYYMNNPEAKKKVTNYLKLDDCFWDEFLASKIPLYVEKS